MITVDPATVQRGLGWGMYFFLAFGGVAFVVHRLRFRYWAVISCLASDIGASVVVFEWYVLGHARLAYLPFAAAVALVSALPLHLAFRNWENFDRFMRQPP